MKKALPFLVVCTLLIILIGSCSNNQNQKFKPKKSTNQLYVTLNSGVRLSLNSINFINVAHGVVAGDSGIIISTTNGGLNWERIGAGLTSDDLYGISVVDALTYIAVGENGNIFRTVDGGATWVSVSVSTTHLRGVAFYSGNEGYAVGDSGLILKTIDKGLTWIKVHSDPSQTLNGISFNSINIPHVVGNNGLILKSIDNGNTWSNMTISSENHYSIHFKQRNFMVHSDTGFVVGDKGIIFRTLDDGLNWDSVPSPTTKTLRGVFISTPHWGYAVGDSGTVLRYNGKGWVLLPIPTDKRLNAVDPVIWNPSSICVGEDGLEYLINPPPVTDSSTVITSGYDPCTWSFILTTEDLKGNTESGGKVEYVSFEVCSSIKITFTESTPSTGWAHNDIFFANSFPLNTFTTYPSAGHPLDPLSLVQDPSGVPTSGYLTCFFMGSDGNPYLLQSYEIECSP